jgi:hypothetical protein
VLQHEVVLSLLLTSESTWEVLQREVIDGVSEFRRKIQESGLRVCLDEEFMYFCVEACGFVGKGASPPEINPDYHSLNVLSGASPRMFLSISDA